LTSTCSAGLDERIPSELLVGHRQVTDAYLLGMAVHCGGRLVTLDRGLAPLLSKSSAALKALHIVETRE